jgi:uncharacterized protein (DUF4415 family)
MGGGVSTNVAAGHCCTSIIIYWKGNVGKPLARLVTTFSLSFTRYRMIHVRAALSVRGQRRAGTGKPISKVTSDPTTPKQRKMLAKIADVVDWFKRQGAGYQTEINAVLLKRVGRNVGVGSLSTRARFARRNMPKITFSNLASKQRSSTRNPMLTNYRLVVTYMQLRKPR